MSYLHLTLTALVLLVAAPVWATDIYVSPSGGGDCSSGSPCSLNTGVSQAQCGDTLFLKGGSYSQRVGPDSGSPSFPSCGSFDHTLTVRPAPGEFPTLRTVDMTNSSHTIIDGEGRLVMDGEDSENIGVFGSGPYRLINFEIRRMREQGVYGCDEGGCEYIDMHIHHIAYTDGVGLRCEETHHASKGLCHGIYVSQGDNILVRGGTFHHQDGFGLHFYPNPDNITIIGATMKDGSKGMVIQGGDGHVVVNNLIYNNPGTGMRLVAGNSFVYHNTVVGNELGFDVRYDGNTVRNNIFYNNDVNWCHDGRIGCSGSINYTASNNLCNGLEEGCTHAGDPLFVQNGVDFKLRAGSPAIGAAPRLATVLTDLEGSRRTNPTTEGAYEFNGTVVPPQQPPSGLVAEYKFETNANSTAPSGTILHHGTLTGNATITAPGMVGVGKVTLDGNGDYVQIPGHADLAPATQFVIFARISTPSNRGRQEIYSAGDSIGFFEENGLLSCFYYNGSSWIEAKTTSIVIPPNTTRHVACGKSQGAADQSDGLRIWVEAAQVRFLPTSGTISYSLGTNVFIGRHGTAAGSYFQGDIDSVRFYVNVPPTQEGVNNDFNELTP